LATAWSWDGAITVASLVVFLRLSGLLQSWEWAALDQFFRNRPSELPEKRILVVGINESDLRYVGQWPVSDAVLAQLLNKLKASKPRAIGLDLYRDLSVPPGTQTLEEVFKSTPNLIGIEKKLMIVSAMPPHHHPC
jgi:adenylate cyclase